MESEWNDADDGDDDDHSEKNLKKECACTQSRMRKMKLENCIRRYMLMARTLMNIFRQMIQVYTLNWGIQRAITAFDWAPSVALFFAALFSFFHSFVASFLYFFSFSIYKIHEHFVRSNLNYTLVNIDLAFFLSIFYHRFPITLHFSCSLIFSFSVCWDYFSLFLSTE